MVRKSIVLGLVLFSMQSVWAADPERNEYEDQVEEISRGVDYLTWKRVWVVPKRTVSSDRVDFDSFTEIQNFACGEIVAHEIYSSKGNSKETLYELAVIGFAGNGVISEKKGKSVKRDHIILWTNSDRFIVFDQALQRIHKIKSDDNAGKLNDSGDNCEGDSSVTF